MGSGAVVSAVASNCRDPRSKYCHQQFYVPFTALKTVMKNKNKKEAGNAPIKKFYLNVTPPFLLGNTFLFSTKNNVFKRFALKFRQTLRNLIIEICHL